MSGVVKVRVLYEDSRRGADPMGLHELVMACVGDETKRPVWDLNKEVEAIPRNSNSHVLKELGSVDGAWVVALLDADRIRSQPTVEQQLKLANIVPSVATPGDVVRAVRALPSAGDRTAVVLLVENCETVIDAVAECVPGLDPQTLARARRKKLAERDIVLRKAAYAAERASRDCVLHAVPSLALLRDKIRCALG